MMSQLSNPMKLAPSANPAGSPSGVVPKPWYAVRVRSNLERMTSLALEGRGLETFLAEYPSRSPTNSARRRSAPSGPVGANDIKRPLFPGYVFCRFDASNRLPVLCCTGVVNIVSFGGQLAVVDEREIAAVRAMQNAGLGAQPSAYLSRGRRVRMEAGPLRGVEGIVTESTDQFRLVLSITLLQRSVLVEVEREWIAPGEALAAGCGVH